MNWLRTRRRSKPSPPRRREPGAAAHSTTDGSSGLLDPNVLARIGSYELIARSIVDGVMSGKHRSTHRGGCSEHTDHRPYSQGDETRLIDWRLFGRRDRHYVKLYADETNLQAWLAVDASASMQFGQSTVTKYEYAARACACLGRLLLRQRDAVGLLASTPAGDATIPPRSSASQFQAISTALGRMTPAGDSPVSELLARIPTLAKRRGMIVVVSDCFGDLDAMASALRKLRVRGHDVLVLQVLAPEEINFSFRKGALFEDLEGRTRSKRVEPLRMRAQYLQRFGAYQTRLRTELTRCGCDLWTLSTADDLGDALARFLSYRAVRNAAARATTEIRRAR